MSKELKTSYKVFAKAYVENGFHGTNAALTAGYSEKTAYSQANQLLKKLEIQEEISRLVNAIVKTSEAELNYRIIEECRKLAFGEVDEESEGFGKLRYTDKLKALELLRKYGCMTMETKAPINVNVELPTINISYGEGDK